LEQPIRVSVYKRTVHKRMDNQQSTLKIDINVKFAYDQESTQMNYKDYNTELEQLKNKPT
jgi:hypothetical protein